VAVLAGPRIVSSRALDRGVSVERVSPWAIGRARRLVAAVTSSTKNDAQLLLRELLSFDLSVHECARNVIDGWSIRYFPNSSMIRSERGGLGFEYCHTDPGLGNEVGVTVGEDDVRVMQDRRVLTRKVRPSCRK